MTLRERDDPFAWVEGLSWHKSAHRAVMANVRLGSWMSAALDDPNVCAAMKADINEWFSSGEPMEELGQALAAAVARAAKLEAALRKIAERDSDGLESYTPQAMNATAIEALA